MLEEEEDPFLHPENAAKAKNFKLQEKKEKKSKFNPPPAKPTAGYSSSPSKPTPTTQASSSPSKPTTTQVSNSPTTSSTSSLQKPVPQPSTAVSFQGVGINVNSSPPSSTKPSPFSSNTGGKASPFSSNTGGSSSATPKKEQNFQLKNALMGSSSPSSSKAQKSWEDDSDSDDID
jgi:hypothetical protein